VPLDVFNFVADYSTEVEIYWKKAKPCFVTPFGGLRVTYRVHLWPVEKRVVDFLLLLIELFQALWANIGRNCVVGNGWVTLSAISGGRGSRGVVCVILRLAVLTQYLRVTHTQTNTQTERHTMNNRITSF